MIEVNFIKLVFLLVNFILLAITVPEQSQKCFGGPPPWEIGLRGELDTEIRSRWTSKAERCTR